MMTGARRALTGLVAGLSAASLGIGGYLLHEAYDGSVRQEYNQRVVSAPRSDLVTKTPVRSSTGSAVLDRSSSWRTSSGRVIKPFPRFGAADARAAGPSMLAIPSVGLRIKLVDAGVNDGVLQIPVPSRAGRWIGSAAPGAVRGALVVAGHVNDRSAALAPMSLAAEAEPGMSVWITDARSRPYRFVVSSRVETTKEQLPAQVFEVDQPLRVSLITCGGPVVRDDRVGGRSHRDNVVVSAVPVSRSL